MKTGISTRKAKGVGVPSIVLLAALVVFFITSSSARCAEQAVQDPAYHNQLGLEYFDKGFYSHTPRLQVQESGQHYRAAEEEFKKAIALDPTYVPAHRNLARLHYVRKNFSEAADAYKRVTELAPYDLDAYVNLALAYVESRKYDAAIEALEAARSRAADPRVRDTLTRYIQAVHKRQ